VTRVHQDEQVPGYQEVGASVPLLCQQCSGRNRSLANALLKSSGTQPDGDVWLFVTVHGCFRD